jgi:hydrogenase maturation protein HypF
MVADLDSARRVAIVSDAAAALLASSAAPIVLVPARGNLLSTEVAPRLREVGVVLGYSPIHHLLFERLDNVPLVMTSANQGGSPIAFREGDLEFVIGLAEGILTHDRPIHIACEDSVLTIDHSGSPLPIRRSRGYVPLPVKVPTPGGREAAVLATGGDLKTTFCLMGEDGQAHISSHLGDMADIRTQDRFGYEYRHLSLITDRRATIVAHDAHPGYATTGWARRQDVPLVAVQHHHAHAVSLLAEHDRIGTRMLAVAFDGTGYGTDGSLWGGELLLISNDPGTFTRVGGLTSFSLPGGDGAVRQPARVALDLLHRNDLPWDCQLAPVRTLGPDRIVMLKRQLARGIGCVPTSSMGRLFDAVASLLDVCQQVTYEGQAAIELENLAYTGTPHNLSFATCGGALDPGPVIAGLVTGLRMGVDRADLAAGFQAAVVRATVRVVMECALSNDVATVGLTGGVFVNRTLLSGVRDGLRNTGFEVLVHQMLPCNDGGLALGQAVIAAGHLG